MDSDSLIVFIRDKDVAEGIGEGSEFIVAIAGEMMRMPGLPKVPAAEQIDIDENGIISGLS